MDPKLRAAMSAVPTAKGAADQVDTGNGPPQTGIFAPGVADKRHPSTVATTIQLGSDGAEPRVSLVSTTDPKGSVKLTLALRTGPRSALPTMDLGLAFSGKGKVDRADSGAAKEWSPLDVRLAKTALAPNQPGQLPEGAAKELAKLNGATFHMLRGPEGGADNLRIESAATASIPELEPVLMHAGEALLAFVVPAPSKPVGVGATWIAETRHHIGAADVISYRLYRVKSAEPNKVILDVEVRQYAASPALRLAGIPEGAKVEQYESTAQGNLELSPGDALAKKGELVQHLGILLQGSAAQAGQQLSLQMDAETRLAR